MTNDEQGKFSSHADEVGGWLVSLLVNLDPVKVAVLMDRTVMPCGLHVKPEHAIHSSEELKVVNSR